MYAGDFISRQWLVQLLGNQRALSVKAKRGNSSGQHMTRRKKPLGPLL